MTSVPQSPPSSASRWVVASLLLLFAVLGVRYSFKVMDNRSAFTRWQPQLMQIGAKDLAREFSYPNPPIMAVLLEPLASLPPVAAAMAWFFLKAGMAIVSFFWIFRLIEDWNIPYPGWAKCLCVLLSLKPIVDDLNHGNVNLFIGFLVIAALTAFRSRRDLLAGLVLALAISCKVTPALFVPYFLWKRQWRVLAGCALGLALFLYPGLLPAARLGWSDNQQQLLSWYEGMVRPFVLDGKVTSEHINQSLPGVAFRLLTASPSFVVWIDGVETPARFDNFLSLSVGQVSWLIKGCMALFVALVIWCCRTPTLSRRGMHLAAEFGLVMLGMLLFSERTWKHHCVVLLLPLSVLCYALAIEKRFWPRFALGLTLLLGFALMQMTGLSGGKGRIESALAPGIAKLALVYGAYTWAFVVLLLGLVGVLRGVRKFAREGRSNNRTGHTSRSI